MTKPLIGVTTGEINDRDHPWTPLVYGQSRTYTDAIIMAGGVPVMVPITDDQSVMDEFYDHVDGWLFAGGNDLEPSLYGVKAIPEVKDFSKNRDTFEVYLMNRALEDRKPILGICRGMQLMNVLRGGDLYQDIGSELENVQDHLKSSKEGDIEQFAHNLRVDTTSKLADILGTTVIPSNTHHHQAIKSLGDDFIATAWAEDGIIEAIEIKDFPFLVGVQPHPESLLKVEPRWRLLFRAFVTASTP